MSIPIYHVDAFTSTAFGGNPAAVCVLQSARDAAWMQAVALEMNLSETAFLFARDDGYELRWFTPAIEVDLCGHATLAAAHVLWSEGLADFARPIAFHTRSGLLTATRQNNLIELDFPLDPPGPCDAPAGLVESLGITPEFLGRGRFDYLVGLSSAKQVRELAPNFGRLRLVPTRGVIVTAPADTSNCDFVSRFFGPAAGVDEDPVTGSAHCCLGAWWSARLGKRELVGYQASARGGYVHVRVTESRAILGGEAITVVRGALLA